MPDEIVVTKLSDEELDSLRDNKLVESQVWEGAIANLEDDAHQIDVNIATEDKKKINIDNEILNLQNKLKEINLVLKDMRLERKKKEHELSKARGCRRIVDRDYQRLHNEYFRRGKMH